MKCNGKTNLKIILLNSGQLSIQSRYWVMDQPNKSLINLYNLIYIKKNSNKFITINLYI